MFSITKKVLILLTVLALIATGTFAMQQTIKASNEFTGRGEKDKEGEGEAVLHDDFDPDVSMKDIYVENLGDADLFIRIKLDEAMNLTSHTWRPSEGDFKTHIYNPAAENCSQTNAAGAQFHNSFTWNMGGWKYYKPAGKGNDKVNDTNVYTEADFNDSSKNIYKTPDAKITTAAAFLAMPETEQKSFIGWIYDTDGYAYWSQALKPGKATGLLLHGVTTSESLKGTDYYYVINVLVEAVDIEDIPMWTEGKESVDGSQTKLPEATEDGKEVIAIIVGGGGNDGNGGGDGGNDGNGDGNGGDGDGTGGTGGDGGNNPGGGDGGDSGGDGDNPGGGDGGDSGDGDGGDSGGDGDNPGGGDGGDNPGGGDGGDSGDGNDSKLMEIPGLSESTRVDTVLNIGGSEWIVIKNIEMEGAKYAMLLKKTAMNHIIFEMSGSSYEGSVLQGEFTKAFNESNIPEALYKNAVVPKLGDDSTSAVSVPTSKMASETSTKKDIIFPLSYKEAVDWSGSTNNSKLNLESQRWWLRTPDGSKWHYVITYTDAPDMGSVISTPTIGIKPDNLHLRPAIWVKYE